MGLIVGKPASSRRLRWKRLSQQTHGDGAFTPQADPSARSRSCRPCLGLSSGVMLPLTPLAGGFSVTKKWPSGQPWSAVKAGDSVLSGTALRAGVHRYEGVQRIGDP